MRRSGGSRSSPAFISRDMKRSDFRLARPDALVQPADHQRVDALQPRLQRAPDGDAPSAPCAGLTISGPISASMTSGHSRGRKRKPAVAPRPARAGIPGEFFAGIVRHRARRGRHRRRGRGLPRPAPSPAPCLRKRTLGASASAGERRERSLPAHAATSRASVDPSRPRCARTRRARGVAGERRAALEQLAERRDCRDGRCRRATPPVRSISAAVPHSRAFQARATAADASAAPDHRDRIARPEHRFEHQRQQRGRRRVRPAACRRNRRRGRRSAGVPPRRAAPARGRR